MKILRCRRCPLYKNQRPAQNEIQKSDVMVIGISAQRNTPNKTFTPLDELSTTGKFIANLEKDFPNKTFYKTNLVKCAPISDQNKIRYPTNQESEKCFQHLEREIKAVNPKTIILLGRHVTTFLSKKFKLELKKYNSTRYKNMTIIPVDHPSYIMIYKRKQSEQYKNKIVNLLEK